MELSIVDYWSCREYNMDWTKHCEKCDVTQTKSKEEKKARKKGNKFDDREFEQMIEVSS